MIKNLLARLLANLKPGNLGLRPHTLSANFAPDSLIAHRSQHNLLERSILHLAPGEAAYLIINGQYTPVYEAGDYPLDPDNIPQTETADILYLNTAATARRPWQSAYQPSQRRLDQPLTGQYTLSIHDPETVCRTIIENQTLELDDDYLDQIISYTIDQSLIHEQVSADDIDYQTEALQNFLKAWLRPQLKPLGQDKIFYRVQHGQQIGPLSANDIQKLVDEGQILAKDLLWQKGMTAWLPADAFNLFNWD